MAEKEVHPEEPGAGDDFVAKRKALA